MRVQLFLTDEELADLLETARTACSYWARTKKILPEAVNKPLTVWEAETGDTLGELSIAKLRPLVFDTQKCPNFFRQLQDMDVTAADVFVQIALFGEVRYG
jgi:hypothetical protein